MEAKDIIIKNKTKLQAILMSNIHFVSECVFEEQLVTGREYTDLKSISLPSKAATELVDKMIFKGETTSSSFLRLLQDTKLTDVFPGLKNRKNLMDQLKCDLDSLQDKMKKYKTTAKKYQTVVPHNKKQVEAAEKQISTEFKKLHQFVTEEEKARLAALKEEEKQKEKNVSRDMKIIQVHISSLSESISAVEQELQKHNVSFLSSYKHTQTSARVQCTLSDPQLDSGALIDVTKHLRNLSFTVWEKMKERVKFTPVILDPNTASRWLCLSEDLTSVRRTDTKPQLPDNPERFTTAPEVLGSEGFSSGKYSWEVEVGDHPSWIIGLAKESVDRKGEKYAEPEYGFWCLTQRDGVYTNGGGDSISLQMNPKRIRVQLDYDRGEVSFYDPEDMTHIYTHKDTFTDKLYPYFSLGKAGDAETIDIRICQVPVMEEILRGPQLNELT